MSCKDVSAHTLSIDHFTVLDTQAVLDWLYFSDPVTEHWETWRRAGHWCWVASVAMRDELAHVLGRGSLPPTTQGPGMTMLLAAFDDRARLLNQPVPSPAPALRCTDPDDQKFLDFAVAHHVSWLVSRDRAVLKLRRRALASHGVAVLPPAAWAPAAVPA